MKALIYVLSSACLWGTIGIYIHGLTDAGLQSLQLVSIRSIFSALILGAVLLFKDRSLFRVRLRHLWMFAGTGIFSLLMFNYAYFNCISLSGMGVAAVLLYTSPVYVTLLAALFFKEKLTGRKLLSMGLAVAGAAMVSGLGAAGGITPAGLLFGLWAGFGYALYSIFSPFALKHYHPLTVTFYTFVFSGLGSLFLVDVPGTAAAVLGDALWLAVLMAVVTGVLPYILYTSGLKYMEASRAAVVACIEPVVAAVLGIALFAEGMTLLRGLGFALVLAGVILINRRKRT